MTTADATPTPGLSEEQMIADDRDGGLNAWCRAVERGNQNATRVVSLVASSIRDLLRDRDRLLAENKQLAAFLAVKLDAESRPLAVALAQSSAENATLLARVKVLEGELNCLAPFLAIHGMHGYSMGPGPMTPIPRRSPPMDERLAELERRIREGRPYSIGEVEWLVAEARRLSDALEWNIRLASMDPDGSIDWPNVKELLQSYIDGFIERGDKAIEEAARLRDRLAAARAWMKQAVDFLPPNDPDIPEGAVLLADAAELLAEPEEK